MSPGTYIVISVKVTTASFDPPRLYAYRYLFGERGDMRSECNIPTELEELPGCHHVYLVLLCELRS